MDLETLWFVLIAVLWAGYFALEGFDFGVGMLLPWVGRDDAERSTMLRTIGPVWDGNEVWLVVAGGATFAAFPAWYATMFSGFYVALLLVLFFLIIRVVSFEWRSKSESAGWRTFWTWCNTIGSVGAALIWGVGLSNLVNGVPIDSNGDYAGDLADLFSPYTVFAGIAVVLLFAFHGATFLTLRTVGDLSSRAARTARRLALPAAAAAAAFLVWTVVVAMDRNDKDLFPPVLPAIVGIVAMVLAVAFLHLGRSGRAFAMTGIGAISVVATLFTGLYPRVMVSDPDFGNSLTVDGAASSHYALQVMSVVALIFVPLVLAVPGLDVLRLPPARRRRGDADELTRPLFVPVILGTPRQGRMSEHAANVLRVEVGKRPEVETELVDIAALSIPVDDEGEAAKEAEFAELVNRADALVLVVPEYNHGYPGLLKHVLDTNLKEYIHKAVGVVGVSAGVFGGARAIQNLLPVLRELGLVTIFWDVNFTTVRRRFDEDGNLVDDSFLAIDKFLDELLWMAKTLRYGRENVTIGEPS